MGLFPSPEDRGHSQKKKKNTGKRAKRLVPCAEREKKKWQGASQRSGNQFFSPYRSISLEACKGQRCLFKVPPGFTSWVTLGFLHGKHEDPISFPYNSKRSEKQGPFRLGVSLAIKFLATLFWGWTLIHILSPVWKWTSLLIIMFLLSFSLFPPLCLGALAIFLFGNQSKFFILSYLLHSVTLRIFLSDLTPEGILRSCQSRMLLEPKLSGPWFWVFYSNVKWWSLNISLFYGILDQGWNHWCNRSMNPAYRGCFSVSGFLSFPLGLLIHPGLSGGGIRGELGRLSPLAGLWC